MVGAVRAKNLRAVVEIAERTGVEAMLIGEVIPNSKKEKGLVIAHTDEGRFELRE